VAVGVGTITGADEIEVTVRDSDVTLAGTVSSREHHDAALAAAANAPGVAGVHDALSVRGDPASNRARGFTGATRASPRDRS